MKITVTSYQILISLLAVITGIFMFYSSIYEISDVSLNSILGKLLVFGFLSSLMFGMICAFHIFSWAADEEKKYTFQIPIPKFLKWKNKRAIKNKVEELKLALFEADEEKVLSIQKQLEILLDE